MRNTPRQMMRSGRGIGTLIGNGFLRESPRNAVPNDKWDVRSRSALRKCMFMPVPQGLAHLFPPPSPQVSGAALPPRRPATPDRPVRAAADEVYRRHDARKNAREFPAFPPALVAGPAGAARGAGDELRRAAQKAAVEAAGSPRGARGAAGWWEDPVALGSLLILLPPVGLAAVWSSKRYSSDARWALTVMTALTMCLMTAIVIAVVMAT